MVHLPEPGSAVADPALWRPSTHVSGHVREVHRTQLRPLRPPRSAKCLPGVLLDRDGTIIVDHGYVGSVDRVELIDGAAKGIAKFNQASIPVAVVTNQAGVARGYYGISDVQLVHEHIADRLEEEGAHVDLFLFCPYHPDGVVSEWARSSHDRKPSPGMAWAAAETLNLDLTVSWVVGDRPEDIGLAEAIGASAVYVGQGPCPHPGVASFPNLQLAADFILDRITA